VCDRNVDNNEIPTNSKKTYTFLESCMMIGMMLEEARKKPHERDKEYSGLSRNATSKITKYMLGYGFKKLWTEKYGLTLDTVVYNKRIAYKWKVVGGEITPKLIDITINCAKHINEKWGDQIKAVPAKYICPEEGPLLFVVLERLTD